MERPAGAPLAGGTLAVRAGVRCDALGALDLDCRDVTPGTGGRPARNPARASHPTPPAPGKARFRTANGAYWLVASHHHPLRGVMTTITVTPIKIC